MASTTPARERMVKKAAQLLHRQGYAATGLAQVLTESPAPRGSLYFHFPGGKAQLAEEALDHGAQKSARAIDRILGSGGDPVTALEDLCDFFGARLRDSNFEYGCALATVALETTADDDALAAACNAGFGAWIDRLARHLTTAGLPEADATEQATFILAAIEGALLLARARRDLGPLETTRRQLAATLQTLLDRTQGPPAAGAEKGTGPA